MDLETLELLLATLTSMWRFPIEESELAAWRQALRPDTGRSLDPETAAGALLALKHQPGYEGKRPSVAVFLEAYSRPLKSNHAPAVPDELPATAEMVRASIAGCRELLAAGRGSHS